MEGSGIRDGGVPFCLRNVPLTQISALCSAVPSPSPGLESVYLGEYNLIHAIKEHVRRESNLELINLLFYLNNLS